MRTDERRTAGAGLLSTSFGVLFFVAFLFFAVQLVFNVYATSVVTSATYDAAHEIAAHGSRPPTQVELDAAITAARQELGRYGRDAEFNWDLSDPAIVKLHVHFENPRLLAAGLDQLVGFDVVDRTAVVRWDRPP